MKTPNKKDTRRTWWIVSAVIVVVLIAAFLLVRARNQANASSQYQTDQVEKGTLTAIIGATGSVRANQTAVLAWQTTGAIGAVNVHSGDKVQAGDVLALLEPTTLSQSIILAQADLVSAQRNLATVKDSNTQRAKAQLALANAQKTYDTAKANFDRLNVVRAEPDTINYYQSQYTLALERVQRAQDAYNATAGLSDSDPARASAYSTLYAAMQQRDQALANLNWSTGKPTSTDQAITEANYAVAQAALQDAQLEWDRLKDGPDPDDVAAAQARLDAVQATLNLARLAAPFAGTVTEVNAMPGDQVSPGTRGFRVDDLSHLLVDVQVSEVDINSVEVNQPVTITFDAVSGAEYHGRVVEVAQAGDVVQGSVNFTVTVQLTDSDSLVKPGMTAAVTIIVKELEDVLLVPNRAVRVVNGQRVVYIMENGQPVEVQITLGASSDSMSEVAAGDLKVGDVIILNPPSTLFNHPDGGGGGFFGGGN